ncbi:multi-copper polyphenol oxidoreductase [Pasteurellaceae bacterium Orientalotternb1]|nr:multi-copper polyphenol oxidoreductase [Pasteurellaceae bacterium Orientalotternb1]
MKIIQPNWTVPSYIHAFTTTRAGGVSQVPFDSLNLGDHVGDNPADVAVNRKILTETHRLPQQPVYLTQTHSTKVLRLPLENGADLNADAVYTNQPNQVCLVMTADCLPAIFCSRDGKEIAAVHAGWRGLCDGVLEATVAAFACESSEIQVWLGPAIGPTAFQVGEEVIEQFVAFDPQAREAFVADPTTSGKFLGNLYQIACQRLNKLGITEISGGDYCTYCDAENFFSYRRDNQTGRMATLIWRSA